MNTRKQSVSRLSGALLVVAGAALASGCLERELKPLNPCLVSGVTQQVAVTNVDKVDILFMVDNSGSMREEQVALKSQFPKLIQTLTTGERMPGDPNPFPPAKDLHLGVISSDMGLVGIMGITGCSGLGDDGIMKHAPAAGATGCQPTYPQFLSYVANMGVTPQQLATDFGCIAELGTMGCGFEQQLEASLKALWPSVDVDETGKTIVPNRITFLADATGKGALGHGDVENRGFLRSDPTKGVSLVAIVLVTDEEDCSSKTTVHFTPGQFLPDGDPLKTQDINLRCFYNPQNQYDITRYVKGFKALRGGSDEPGNQGNEQLVIYAGIVGVPPDLVDAQARAAVDFTNDASRNAYYDLLLADPRMKAEPDPAREPGNGNLKPSCVTPTGVAYPPRRMIEVAKAFGENAVIQSICQDDFGPAMDAIIEVIAKQLGAVCLPRSLVRKSDGLVGCNVVWELPQAGMAPPQTPTECSQQPFLSAPDDSRAKVSKATGGNVCVVKQLPVMDSVSGNPPAGEGWFYDNFTMGPNGVFTQCPANQPQRVAFSSAAKPPTGVTVKLECLNETQSLANNRTDTVPGTQIRQPEIGTACKDQKDQNGNIIDSAVACEVTLKDTTGGPSHDGKDRRMFCHPTQNVCVMSCKSDNDCPPAWVCDERPETKMESGDRAYCVNPTCGSD